MLFFILILSHLSFAGPNCGPHKDPKSQQKALLNFLALPQSDLCRSLKVGEKRDVKISRKVSPTGLPHRYRLHRIDEKTYKLSFNIQFYDSGDRKAAKTEDLEREDLMDRAYTYAWRNVANKCLEKVQDKLKGPHGETLKIVVEEGHGKNKVPLSDVGLRDRGRAHSASWIKDMSCATVLHELLHLTGLVDEYDEQESGYKMDPKTGKMKWVEEGAEKLGYDCRKLASGESVMADHNVVWIRTFAPWRMTINYCQCNDRAKCDSYFSDRKKRHDAYMAEMSRGTPSKPTDDLFKISSECPSGFAKHPKGKQEFFVSDEEKASPYFGIGKTLPEGITPEQLGEMVVIKDFTPMKENDKPSMLEESHWNAIVFPGCYAKNWQYYQDSENAYRTSKERGGEGCIDNSWARPTR